MAAVTLAKAARQISEIVGHRISPSTLRSWCNVEQFQPFLSDDATPAPGTTRLLTPHDIQTLTRIAEYRRRNLPYEDIAIELAAPPEPPTPTAPSDAPQTITDEPGTAMAAAMPADIATLIQATSSATNQRLTDIEQRVNRIESTRTNAALVMGAFAVGALTVAIIAVLVFLMMQ